MAFPFVHCRVCFYSAISCCGEASRGVSDGLAVAVRRSRWHLDHRRFRQLQGRSGVIPNLLGQRHVTVQLLAVARHNSVNAALPLRRVKLLREHLLEHVQGDRRGGGSPRRRAEQRGNGFLLIDHHFGTELPARRPSLRLS